MKKFVLFNVLIMLVLVVYPQPKPIKNVILMIPDGASTSLLSAARWYQTYYNPSQSSLNLDPFFTGLVQTCSSDAPIGDSAPTTSCYMTGQPTQAGFVSTYPVKTANDLFPIDANQTYRPLATILEGAKQMQHKATGLVFTCEFPHATPADCSSHTYKRSRYDWIAPQMVHNDIDVVIGGGVSYLNETNRNYLKENNYQVFLNDVQGMRQCTKAPFWALFDEKDMCYEMDRNPQTTPSLAEMTEKAIQTLSANPNGFFLMVEGSKVDFAAHSNDAKAEILDFLAFDKACKVAFDFAQQDGQTVVVVLPDHGCGALTIGSRKSNSGYNKIPLKDIIQPLENMTISGEKMAGLLKNSDTTEWPALFKKYYNMIIDNAEVSYLQSSSDYDKSPLPKSQRKHNLYMEAMVNQIVYRDSYFGFTTNGHTGENVFLAMYHPQNDILTGCPTNVDIYNYLCKQTNLTDSLSVLTQNIYADHHEVFKDYTTTIDSIAPDHYVLTVKNKKNTLTADSYTNFVTVNKNKVKLSSVIVYMPINQTFYLPKDLYRYLEIKK